MYFKGDTDTYLIFPFILAFIKYLKYIKSTQSIKVSKAEYLGV